MFQFKPCFHGTIKKTAVLVARNGLVFRDEQGVPDTLMGQIRRETERERVKEIDRDRKRGTEK